MLKNPTKVVKDVRNFIEGNWNYSKRDSMPTHIREQIVYKALMCPRCTEAGKCIEGGPRNEGCGCPVPKMLFSQSKKDPSGRWEEGFKSAEEWEPHKKAYNTLFNKFPKLAEKVLKHWATSPEKNSKDGHLN